MEHTSVLSGVSIVLKVAELCNKIIGSATNLTVNDAAYYNAWSLIASEAIKGLEQEYIGILVQAAYCQLDDPQQQQGLLERMDLYIRGEVLRPILRDAINHLQAGRQALDQHAHEWLIWPRVRTKRATALVQYDQLLGELNNYLGMLGEYDRDSGVGLHDLYDLKALLLSESYDAFMDKVDDLLTNLRKARLVELTTQCAQTIETLRIAFR